MLVMEWPEYLIVAWMVANVISATVSKSNSGKTAGWMFIYGIILSSLWLGIGWVMKQGGLF